MHIMSITQIDLNWREDHFFFVRTWVLENNLTADEDREGAARPHFPIPGLNAVPADIERFLLRYYPVIRDWIAALESREIEADMPAMPFEDFLGKYDAQNSDS